MNTINPLFVANNLLNLAFKEKNPVTPMKLQKLLYFIYRDYLQKTKESLFSERFEAWKYGPVLSSVYSKFHQYESNKITEYYKSRDGKVYILDEKSDYIFSEVLQSVWNQYKSWDGIQLCELTHKEGTAWYKAWTKNESFLKDEDIKSEVLLLE